MLDGGHSCLALGEVGTTNGLPEAIAQRFNDRQIGTAVYKGALKKWLINVAESLGVETTEPKLNKEGEQVGERNLNTDELKEEILGNVGPQTLLILPQADRLSTGARYWLEDVIATGACIAAIAPRAVEKDIFLEMVRIELELLTDAAIRSVMQDETQRLGMTITDERLAEIQTLAGRNPGLARMVVRRENLGLRDEAQNSHTQYLNVTPILYAALAGFAAAKFMGMGLGDKSLQVFGGLAFMALMSLKQLGQIKGARKVRG